MTDTTTEERLADKIAKLLAKAEGTDVQHEADAFFEKAEELMLQHAIAEDAVRARMGRTISDKIVKHNLQFKGIFRSAQLLMGHKIGEAFGFKTVKTKIHGSTIDHLTWIGFERELKDAAVILASLEIQCARAMKVFARRYKAEHPYADKQALYVARRSFIDGYGNEAARRIKATQARVINEAAKIDNTLLPVLAQKADLVKAAMDEMYPKLGTGRAGGGRRDAGAFGAGKQAAQNADVGNTRIAGRRAIGS